MSLWLCPIHGLGGPVGCCAAASRAEVEPSSVEVVVYFEAPAPDVPRRPEWGTVSADDL